MSSTAPARAHFQQLANLVHDHAAAKDWPAVIYQAAFIAVIHPKTGEQTLEGNSVRWDSDWDAEGGRADHPVSVGSGEEAWAQFLAEAFYPDLLRADEAVQKL